MRPRPTQPANEPRPQQPGRRLRPVGDPQGHGRKAEAQPSHKNQPGRRLRPSVTGTGKPGSSQRTAQPARSPPKGYRARPTRIIKASRAATAHSPPDAYQTTS